MGPVAEMICVDFPVSQGRALEDTRENGEITCERSSSRKERGWGVQGGLQAGSLVMKRQLG